LAAREVRADPETDRKAWSEILQLANRFRLTLYDAAYLELAQRLASLDNELTAADQMLGVPLLGL
jgi:predicted nucleic acid-binding protein